MADRVQFELVTPERLLLSEMVEMVVVPGTEGNFGVLPGHAPLISSIRPGTIDIYEGQSVTRRIFVVSGIAEVTPELCTVLADEAMAPDEVDRSAIEAELQTVQGNLPSLREQVGRAAGAKIYSKPNCAPLVRSLADRVAWDGVDPAKPLKIPRGGGVGPAFARRVVEVDADDRRAHRPERIKERMRECYRVPACNDDWRSARSRWSSLAAAAAD
jgi:F-type H+-transporting ATPase subunit epsilon